MSKQISSRLASIVNALPIKKGMKILEIGCGPGIAAREIVKLYPAVHIVAIDRSEKSICQATEGSKIEISTGKLEFRTAAVENFELAVGEKPFDLAFAIRVGALDGRHPEIEKSALQKIAKALTKTGRLFIDGGNPLKEISLKSYR
jgi:ubiquinone/menaquinone biosynthesis C-methylase UbiE